MLSDLSIKLNRAEKVKTPVSAILATYTLNRESVLNKIRKKSLKKKHFKAG